jgi:regulatory protein YycI of two-component signal transduction system YycFG
MHRLTTNNVLEEIKKEVEELLKKENIKWDRISISETSDGYLVIVRTPQFQDDMKAIEVSLRLEDKLKDPSISLSLIPTS